MPPETWKRQFTFEENKTCNREWNFTLARTKRGLIIEDLDIVAHVNESGSPRGCEGHPKTIIAMIRGLPIDAINIDALAVAGCARETSCGQALARCLWTLKAEMAAHS